MPHFALISRAGLHMLCFKNVSPILTIKSCESSWQKYRSVSPVALKYLGHNMEREFEKHSCLGGQVPVIFRGKPEPEAPRHS